MNDRTITPAEREQSLKRSFENVTDAAGDLLRTTVDETNAEWRRTREALKHRAKALKSRLSGRARDIGPEARNLGAKGRRLARRHPWSAIGIGMAIGLVTGLLVRHQRGARGS